MPEREQQNAPSSSGRKESHNPNAQASGDRLQSKGDDDMTKGFLRESSFFQFWLRGLKKTFRNLSELTVTISSQHCKVMSFRTRLHVGTIPNEQISRYL